MIEFIDVSKSFRFRQLGSGYLLKDFVFNLFSRNNSPNSFWALRNVSFRIEKNELVGIIGKNGSGKSTIIKILSRIYQPTSGKVICTEKVSPLVELSAGFHPDLTGLENIFLNGAILGMPRKQIKAELDSILNFAEIGKFIDMQVKHYSLGMSARLAFAIAVFVQTEVLLIDEVLAVGDTQFQERCIQKILELKQRGTTIIFVSHNLEQIRNVCGRVLWIDAGQLRMDDLPDRVIAEYQRETATSLSTAG